MFGRADSTDTRQVAVNDIVQPSRTEHAVGQTQHPKHTFISSDVQLTGDIVSTGDVTIEGTLDGKIECRSLTLSGNPSISGSVQAETVHVCGSFEGELHAKKVVLAKTSRMIGKIFQESLEIHPGAIFEGQVSRQDNRPTAGTTATIEPDATKKSANGSTEASV
jgi:cytoskeletal protein CcmA (bactofilin family)